MNSEIKTYYIVDSVYSKIQSVEAIQIDKDFIKFPINNSGGFGGALKPHWYATKEEAIRYLNPIRYHVTRELEDQAYKINHKLKVLKDLAMEMDNE